MQTSGADPKKKIAVIVVNNEIVMNAVKKSVEKIGYEVRQDIDSCLDAKFGIIGSYFTVLGIVKQMRTINPLLPVVVITDNELSLENGKDLYDVIQIDSPNELEISRKIEQWFSQGKGKFLVNGGQNA